MSVTRTSSRSLFSWAAAVALIAVLFQALASGAMAHTVAGGEAALVICSAEGPSAVTVDHDGQARLEKIDPAKTKTKSGLPCQDCVAAATAAVVPPAPATGLVRYARQAEVWRQVSDTVHKQARAPPRPPSRAPPVI